MEDTAPAPSAAAVTVACSEQPAAAAAPSRRLSGLVSKAKAKAPVAADDGDYENEDEDDDPYEDDAASDSGDSAPASPVAKKRKGGGSSAAAPAKKARGGKSVSPLAALPAQLKTASKSQLVDILIALADDNPNLAALMANNTATANNKATMAKCAKQLTAGLYQCAKALRANTAMLDTSAKVQRTSMVHAGANAATRGFDQMTAARQPFVSDEAAKQRTSPPVNFQEGSRSNIYVTSPTITCAGSGHVFNVYTIGSPPPSTTAATGPVSPCLR